MGLTKGGEEKGERLVEDVGFVGGVLQTMVDVFIANLRPC
jgi:hypothetical protein